MRLLYNISKILAVLLVVFGLFYLSTFLKIQNMDYSYNCDNLNVESGCLILQHNMFVCQNANYYFNSKDCSLQNITIQPPIMEKFKY